MTTEESQCVARWDGDSWRTHRRCNACPHPYDCHEETGCHARGCACDVDPHVTCGVALTLSATGACAECGAAVAQHCLAEDPDEEHLCAADREHHAYQARLVHVGAIRWNHNPKPGRAEGAVG